MIRVDRGADGHLDLAQVLQRLWERGIVSVLCEGGAVLAGALLAGGYVDRLYAFVAPVLLGDDGVAMARLPGPDSPTEGTRLAQVRRRTYGDDVLVSGRLPD